MVHRLCLVNTVHGMLPMLPPSSLSTPLHALRVGVSEERLVARLDRLFEQPQLE